MPVNYALFGREYEIQIDDGNDQKLWSKLDMSFRIIKTNDTTANELELEIFNLNKSSRDFINRKNLNVILRAGYGKNIGQIFKGNTELINHDRQHVDWISKVYSKDGGAAIRNLVISKSFKKDTPYNTVIESVLKSLQDLPPGLQTQLQQLNKLAQGNIDLLSFKPKKPKVKAKKKTKQQKPVKPVSQQQKEYQKKKTEQRETSTDKKLKTDLILKGRAEKKLKMLCEAVGLDCNITDQTINIWPASLALTTDVIQLDSSSGLLGSPELTEDGSWKIKSLLRHEFNPGTLVSITSRYLDSIMLIRRVEHYGATNSNDWCSEIFCTEFDI